MLTDSNHPNEVSEASDDLLRTSIAVDRERVKPLAPPESPTSDRVGPVEPGDGLGRQLWLESGEHLARPAAGSEGRDAAATLAAMLLSGQRQSWEAAAHFGGRNVFCALAAALVLVHGGGNNPPVYAVKAFP